MTIHMQVWKEKPTETLLRQTTKPISSENAENHRALCLQRKQYVRQARLHDKWIVSTIEQLSACWNTLLMGFFLSTWISLLCIQWIWLSTCPQAMWWGVFLKSSSQTCWRNNRVVCYDVYGLRWQECITELLYTDILYFVILRRWNMEKITCIFQREQRFKEEIYIFVLVWNDTLMG